MRKHRAILCAVPLIGLMACGSPEPAAEAEPTIQVTTVRAVRADLAHTLLAYGALEVDPAAMIGISVPFEARLGALKTNMGRRVVRGQVLFEAHPAPPALVERDRLAREAAASEAEAARLERLRAEGLSTNAELASARLAAGNASAALRLGTTPQTDASGAVAFSAPADGTVESIAFRPDDAVAAGSTVLRIVPSGHLVARLGVEPDDVAAVRPGQAVSLQPLRDGAAVVEGRVLDADARIDAKTRLCPALVQVPAGNGFLAGESLSARIVLERRAEALSVPRTAILGEGADAAVFVVSEGEAHRRPVTPGWTEGDRVEVVAGLAEGEAVVVEGNRELADGMAVRDAAAP